MAVIFLGGGLPGASPDTIAGSKLWYDSAVNVYEDEAATDPAETTDQVRSWVDRISGYKIYTVGGAGTGPTYTTGSINGYPTLDFDASNDQLYTNDNNADLYFSTQNTMFAVTSFADAVPANQQNVIWFSDGVQACGLQVNAGAATISARNYDGSVDLATKAFTPNQYNSFTFMNNGTNVYIGVNDTRTASMTATASGNMLMGANGALYLRNFPAAANAMKYAEMIVFNVALSEANRQAIEQRLAYKYNITLPY